MRTTARTAVAFSLAVVVLAVAAVAAAQAPSPSASPDTPTSAPANPGTGDPSATCPVGTPDCRDTPMEPPGEPQVVEPTPGMANVRARPFDSASVGDDGRTVTIDFVSGVEPCYVLDRVEVAYAEDTVTITLFEGNDPTAGDVACIEIGVFKRTIVTLDEPLGDRTIVDGGA